MPLPAIRSARRTARDRHPGAHPVIGAAVDDVAQRPVEHQFVGAGQAAGGDRDAADIEGEGAGVQRRQQRAEHGGRNDHEQVEDQQAQHRDEQAHQVRRVLLLLEGMHVGVGAQGQGDLLRVVQFARDVGLKPAGGHAVDEALFVPGQGLRLQFRRQAEHGAFQRIEVLELAHGSGVTGGEHRQQGRPGGIGARAEEFGRDQGQRAGANQGRREQGAQSGLGCHVGLSAIRLSDAATVRIRPRCRHRPATGCRFRVPKRAHAG
jgi:hypothetical protein